MINIGITGQSGFIGTHLYNRLGLYPEQYTRIPFEDSFFEDESRLNGFVSQCDAIVHLAAMNRHNDPELLYKTNIRLVKQLITAMEKSRVIPHVLFSSSTHEERDNHYGRSKKEGRKLLAEWAEKTGAQFSGLVIPNVFGPFGNPYYNSVVATFCHQLTHNETPGIDVDSEMKLIYVGELVEVLVEKIRAKGEKTNDKNRSVAQTRSEVWGKKSKRSEDPASAAIKVNSFNVPHTSAIRVSELLEKLEGFRRDYFQQGIMPNLEDPFIRNLFNTFGSYIDHATFFPFHLKLNTDDRGTFVETIKLNSGGQVSFSTTRPGSTRGNHFHTRKAERFAVIMGKARIELRRIGTEKVLTFDLDGTQPSFVDMPVWHTHNITNVGKDDLYTMFWINEFYNADDTDTFFEKV